MIIDLFTVIAQIINFLILVLLLRKFLFNKIIDIIDEREHQIKEKIEKAEKQQKEAEEEIKKQREIREKLEQEWEDNLAKIKKEIQDRREKMMQEARESVNQVQEEWKRAILSQRKAYIQELKKLSSQQICLISKKVLADLANAKLENQLIDSFINQLEGLKEHKKKEFSWDETMLNNQNKNKVEILTTFPLNEELKETLTKQIKKMVGSQAQPIFQTSPDLVCGIELRTMDKKIAWSMENYLDLLEEKLKNFLEENQKVNELPTSVTNEDKQNKNNKDDEHIEENNSN